jgi:hypothetical protein
VLIAGVEHAQSTHWACSIQRLPILTRGAKLRRNAVEHAQS